MKILNTDLTNPDQDTIRTAVNVLKSGGLIIYPTDTAYGLGGNAFNSLVINKVYDVQKRVSTKPTHIIVRDWKMIEQIAYTTPLSKKAHDIFLPGPLTIILKKRSTLPDNLTGRLPTVGVRIPNCKVTMEISSHVDFPYTTPSANRSGGKTPYSIKEVKKELDFYQVDLAIDAGMLPINKPSTLLDLSANKPKILREGPILKSDIEKALNIIIKD